MKASLSAWLPDPDLAKCKTVVVLPDGFKVVRELPSSRRGRAVNNFFLMHDDKQAGSASCIRFTSSLFKVDSWFVDVVYLEPEYRGKNYMRSLLWFVVRNFRGRPLLIDAHESNLSTYKAVGFVEMDEAQLSEYKSTLEYHRRQMHYDRPLKQYIPLILS